MGTCGSGTRTFVRGPFRQLQVQRSLPGRGRVVRMSICLSANGCTTTRVNMIVPSGRRHAAEELPAWYGPCSEEPAATETARAYASMPTNRRPIVGNAALGNAA
jgi:hypothetical protein